LPSQHGQTVSLTNLPTGIFFADWYDPASGGVRWLIQSCQRETRCWFYPCRISQKTLLAVLRSLPGLKLIELSKNEVQLQLDSETGGHYIIQQSDDLLHWSTVSNLTNFSGTTLLTAPTIGSRSAVVFSGQTGQLWGPNNVAFQVKRGGSSPPPGADLQRYQASH
jgi:hypothetical protein